MNLLAPALVALLAGVPAPSDYVRLARPGDRIPLDAETSFVYGFTKAPKLGTATLRVEILRRDGTRDTSFTVRGDADMPSMRGAHSTGSKAFSVSSKGVYLLPVNLVMPGDWEVRLTFERGGKTLLRGAYLFDI
ncbi:FixH family protein [Geothrix sp. 21YS21S-2]|uniref:FixH family protein n=1 Tax=Geothrix sp. 21YS21S-2 TaxID=3068893 RepID=UPI0027BACFB1|nr:FixH family protein [Geothrix sp. 21YS21S-2]